MGAAGIDAVSPAACQVLGVCVLMQPHTHSAFIQRARDRDGRKVIVGPAVTRVMAVRNTIEVGDELQDRSRGSG